MPLSKKQFAELLRGTPPDASQDQINQAAAEVERGTPMQRVWEWLKKPLVGAPDSPFLAHEHSEDESGFRRIAEDLGSSLTSPLDLGTTALGVGGAMAGAKGLLGISKAARAGEAALLAPLAAEGARNAIQAESVGEAVGGLAQAGLAGYGARNAARHAFPVKKVASTYMKEAGLTNTRVPTQLDPERSKRIADAYEAMPHNPNDPNVASSYGAMADDVEAQYDFLVNRAGVKMEPWTQPGQPYASSAEMVADVEKNNHLFYFPSESGFGTGDDVIAGNPLLARGKRNDVVLNDQFRAVHDYFGHAQNRNQFGPKGEEAAWNDHVSMFSRDARPAMTTETRGQNSWVNFGPHLRDSSGNIPGKGQPGFVPPQERPFAPQKTGLLPAEFSETEVLPQGDELARSFSTSRNAATPQSGIGKPSQDALSFETVQTVKNLHDTNGGTTFNLREGDMAGKPFFSVSIFPDRGQILDHPPSEQELANFIHRNSDLLADPKNSIGTWFNPDDGKHYLDISATVPSREEALALGAKHNQLAIFDLQTFETIDVPKAGTNVPNLGSHQTAEADNITRNSPYGEGSILPSALMPTELKGSTALAVASPAASAAIDDSDPNDPNRELKTYGKLALNILGMAGAANVGMAALRKNAQSPQKAAAARGAAYMLLGGKKTDWMKRMLGEGVSKEDLPKIRAASEKMLAAQLLKAEGKMPNAKKLMQHFESGKVDMGWYDNVHTELEELFGKDANLMAQLLAATSSNATVKSNVTLALKAYAKIKAGEPITDGFLPAVVQQVNRVIAGKGLEGRKIDNFAKAIMGDPDAVVVDRWMMRAFGFPKDAPTPHEYDVIEHAVKELAKQKGVTPRQMQASIWFAVKNQAESARGVINEAPPYTRLLREKQSQQKLNF